MKLYEVPSVIGTDIEHGTFYIWFAIELICPYEVTYTYNKHKTSYYMLHVLSAANEQLQKGIS